MLIVTLPVQPCGASRGGRWRRSGGPLSPRSSHRPRSIGWRPGRRGETYRAKEKEILEKEGWGGIEERTRPHRSEYRGGARAARAAGTPATGPSACIAARPSATARSARVISPYQAQTVSARGASAVGRRAPKRDGAPREDCCRVGETKLPARLCHCRRAAAIAYSSALAHSVAGEQRSPVRRLTADGGGTAGRQVPEDATTRSSRSGSDRAGS